MEAMLHEMEVAGLECTMFNKPLLFYLYHTGKPDQGHDLGCIRASVHTVRDEWTMVYLNGHTGEKREALDDDEEA